MATVRATTLTFAIALHEPMADITVYGCSQVAKKTNKQTIKAALSLQ